MNFEHIHIVLVETSHPGNIGAAARAMKTMGLSSMRLVSPKQFPCKEASDRASGADDVLASAEVFDDLAAAVTDCTRVVGATARMRHVTGVQHCVEAVINTLPVDVPIALVFGRERSGLTNEECDLCDTLVRIPTNEEFGSLNLGSAVQVVCYEIRKHGLGLLASTEQSTNDTQVAYPTAEQRDYFYRHLEQVMTHTDFLKPENPRHIMRRMREVFNRAVPTANELNMLRGLLDSVKPFEE